ncbi:MAG: hypothetical protein P4L67_03660 [Candidatus Pacebacteria bacterium]|nr:hypothetical protein [Candidatus Paceibacterota bacterium]
MRKRLDAINEVVATVERSAKKEEARLEDLKFREQGLEGERKHIQEAIHDMSKQIEEAIEKQKEYEEEQSYNRATQIKLLQTLDQKIFKQIKAVYDKKDDSLVQEAMTLVVSLLNLKPTVGEAEIKEALTSHEKFTSMMQDSKLEDISSVDEKEYYKTQDVLTKKFEHYGSDKKNQEKKDMCSILLHYVVFTIGISMAKRNLQRAIGRLEKMQKDLITKKAELAKKVISAVDPLQIKLSGASLASYKEALNKVRFRDAYGGGSSTTTESG